MRLVACIAMAVSISAGPAFSAGVIEASGVRLTVTVVAEGLSNPWGLAFLPDGRLLVTERPGAVRIISRDGALSPPLAGAPATVAERQGGMLDVTLHPDFARNQTFYLCHVTRGEGGTSSTMTRARLVDDRIVDATSILAVAPRVVNGLHFGCRMAFGADGMLYAGFGDRFQMQRAQDLSDLNGKLVRIRDDGSIPADNPFVGRPGARGEIWSYGHRNIQGLTLRPGTTELWAHEHGPQGGDEVNLILRGANYGWPRTTHGVNYGGATITNDRSLPGIEDPRHVWVPSIAPSGMAFHPGGAIPAWRGSLLVGALRDRMLVRLTVDGTRIVAEERIAMFAERIRDVRVAPDGRVHLLTDDPRGAIWRLDPA